MNPRLLVFLSLLALPALPLQAQVLDQYQATVKVENQGAAARDKALREALSGVLARVSGQPDLSTSGRTAPILARANALVRSVSYVPDEQNGLQLQAVFEPAAVDSALKQQGLPVHGVVGATLESVTLTVSGIGSPEDYARVLAHVRGLPGVKNVGVTVAAGDSLGLSLRAEGGAARLAGALGVSGILRRNSGEGSELNYTLKR